MSAESQSPVSGSVEKLKQEFDRWLEAAMSQGERAMDVMGLKTRNHPPVVDIVETPEEVKVYVNLPGVAATDIDLSLTGNMLSVSGAYPAIDLGDAGEVRMRERGIGLFQRTIPLPSSVDAEQVSAECANGILCVTIAKAASEKPRKISISSPGSSHASS